MRSPLRLGISSCLLGAEVRWDGGHKRDAYLTGEVGPQIEWVSVCPEVELGMGVPREPIHLRLDDGGGGVRLVGMRSARDWTDAMSAFAARRARELSALDLDGYILKSKSPTCGLQRLKIHDARGEHPLSADGVGFFASALQCELPELPLEEEGRLGDPLLRETFFVRALAFRRVKALFRSAWSRADLVAFHAAEKLLLLAYDEVAARELGRLVASPESVAPEVLASRYRASFLRAFRSPSSRGRHTNVLEHVAGMLRENLDDGDARELREAIESYRTGAESRLVPLTLLRHHVRRVGLAWLRDQTYLAPTH